LQGPRRGEKEGQGRSGAILKKALSLSQKYASKKKNFRGEKERFNWGGRESSSVSKDIADFFLAPQSEQKQERA